jgi:hypothetical protein
MFPPDSWFAARENMWTRARISAGEHAVGAGALEHRVVTRALLDYAVERRRAVRSGFFVLRCAP